MSSKPGMPWRDAAQRKVDRSYGPAGGDGIGDFAAGFIMRPFAAAVFGWFGDRNGRARTMQISVALIAFPTVLFGALIGITGVRIRRNLHESERFRAHHTGREKTSPLLEAFTTNRRETLLALVFAASYGTCYYIACVYLPEWLPAQNLMSRGSALTIHTAMMIVVIPAMPLTAVVGDKWLPRRVWIGLSMLVLALVLMPVRSRMPLR